MTRGSQLQRFRVRLPWLLAGAFTLTALGIGWGGVTALKEAHASIVRSSEATRRAAAHRVEERVARALAAVPAAIAHFERELELGVVNVDQPEAVLRALLAELQNTPSLAEVTWTRANWLSDSEDGRAQFADALLFQVTAVRLSTGKIELRLVTRSSGAEFTAQVDVPRGLETPERLFSGRPTGSAQDPREHPTFFAPAAPRNRGRTLFSDLHYAEWGSASDAPTVVLSAQKALLTKDAKPLGVLRVALFTEELDTITQMRVSEADENDPHRIVLLAPSTDHPEEVRLLTRCRPTDPIVSAGDELRVAPVDPPRAVKALLTSDMVHNLGASPHDRGGRLQIGTETYLASLVAFSLESGGTLGWHVGIVVPEHYYTRELRALVERLLLLFAMTLGFLLIMATLSVEALRRGLSKVARTTWRMRRFDFSPEPSASAVLEIDEVMSGLERAKTVVRAMEKYIPKDLVQTLYAKNHEPTLGGELRQVTLLFSDIEGFTTLSEQLSPTRLAELLGEYLEVMTRALAERGGTIDKFIGDGVMAFFNAPLVLPSHPRAACHAVLEARRALAELYASPRWAGLAPLKTRFGLHSGQALVGHFGASSRFAYTALGDSVNLAARLESMCKQYGVTCLVSESVVAEAGAKFLFRFVDQVAVKGKQEATRLYELLNFAGTHSSDDVPYQNYESAWEAYAHRDFAGAIKLLEAFPGDGPSFALAERARRYLANPPPDGWNGTFIANSK